MYKETLQKSNMDLTLERDSSALGSLFQQIINDMKNSSPLWEDFVAKASKLHACLRAAIQAIAAYLDAFQKIADAATNSRGASKEIGTALTRVCLRHKAVETRLKTFTTAIMDCLVQPLQDKLEDWKRSVASIDKEHAKEYKRCRTELKKRSSDTLRLQKKARKGQSDTIQSLMDSHMQDVTLRRAELEEVEKKSLRSAMVEERMRYCTFVHMLQPVVKEECEVMFELGHLQEAMQSIANVTKDPAALPQASEELIHDTKATMSLYPESPGGGSGSQGGCSNSLGSRKSSVCSISSMNSSGSSNSPGHHHYPRSLSQLMPPATIRLKPGESSDSGFCSSPALTTQASTATSQSHAVSTWPPHSQENVALPPADDRPHTISTTYEKGHQRPPLTVYTFQNPETIVEGVGSVANGGGESTSGQNTPTVGQKSPGGVLSRPPLPVRCSSLERPLSANNRSNSGNLTQRQCPSPIPAHITKELSSHHAQQQQQQQQQQPQQTLPQPSQSPPPPTYVNMSELANMASKKAHTNHTLQQQHSTESITSQFSNDFVPCPTPPPTQHQHQHHQHAPHAVRSHSTTSSTTSSLHSHPSIESTVATSLLGQTPPTSSGSSTPQNHYSPLLTNSPTSTGAGTPSGASITSGVLAGGGFNYNVCSPTPPHSGTPSSASDVLKITESEASTNNPNNTTTTNAAIVNGSPNNCTEKSSHPVVDTDSPTIVENDERSRASVLQKASMFEKQAAAAASTPPPQMSSAVAGREAIYGTRRSDEYRERDRSLPTHLPQQQQPQQQPIDQQDVDKSFEDSIQELNNLIGELDSFQREIDAGKQQQQQQQSSMMAMTTLDPFAPSPILGTSGNADDLDAGVDCTATTTTTTGSSMAPGGGVSITAATATLLRQQQQKQPGNAHYCPSSGNQTNSSGCGTDISDTTSDELAADDNRSLASSSYTNHNTSINNNNAPHANTSAGLKLNCHNYNSDSELSRCYVSETSSLAGGYENPTFAHIASSSSSSTTALNAAAAAVAAGSATSGAVTALDDSIGDSCSLLAAADSMSHTSDTLSLHRHAYVDTASDSGSAVVVIYDHQIPMTPDIDYVKQNSEIVVLRTKDPQQQHHQPMHELQQLPANLSGPPDSPSSSFGGVGSGAAGAPTATVAPAKQRLSSFRASSEQQLQLLGLGGAAGRCQSPLYDKGRLDQKRKELPARPPMPQPKTPTTSAPPTPTSDTIIRRKLPPKPSLSVFNGHANNNNQNAISNAVEINNNNNHSNNHNHSQQAAPPTRPPVAVKVDFKADLDAKIRKQKLKLQMQEQQQQQSSATIIQAPQQQQSPPTTTTTTTTVNNHPNNNCNTASTKYTVTPSPASSTPISPTCTPIFSHSQPNDGSPQTHQSSASIQYNELQQQQQQTHYQSSHHNSNNNKHNSLVSSPQATTTTTSVSPSSQYTTHPTVVPAPFACYNNHNAPNAACSTPSTPSSSSHTNCALGGMAPTTTATACPPTTANVNKPNITPRPASLAGGGTRIARRSSVNTAKPPPPVRRSSSVTPSHNVATGNLSQTPSLQSSSSNLMYHQQNSLANSTESLPPPPAFMLETRPNHTQTTSTPPPPPPPLQQQQQQNPPNGIPNSALKVAETVKALSAIRHKPASPNALRHLHQQSQQQQQQQHQQQSALQNIYSTSSVKSPAMLHDEPDYDYESAYYNPYVEVQAAYVASNANFNALKLLQNDITKLPPMHSNHTQNASPTSPPMTKYPVDERNNQPPPLPPPNPNQKRSHSHQQQQHHHETQQQQQIYQQHHHQQQTTTPQEQFNNIEAIYGDNSSFRTTSPGIYAQPKIMNNMSSFRTASPGPNGHHVIHHPQAHHAGAPPAQPKTNPNLIAQLNARLNNKQQQQNAEPLYGVSQHQAHHNQPHQQHEPIYMRNYGQQQQQPSSQSSLHQQQQQQQQYHDDYASTQVDKTGSIRSKTKAEFLENLNAKLAKQGMSGRAFAVRNLINSKALPDPRVCHESLMDQIKRGATLKRNQKINDRSAPKIH